MTHSPRRGVAACLTVLALVSLSACSSTSPSTPANTSSAIGTAGGSAGSASPSSTASSFAFTVGSGTVAPRDLGERISTAQKSLRSYHQVTSITAGSLEMSLKGDIDRADTDTPRAHAWMTMSGETFEMVVRDSAAWVRQDGKWVKSDMDLSYTSVAANPADPLKALDASTRGSYLGRDSSGHHFSFVLDRKALARWAADRRGASSDYIETLPSGATAHYELWTTDDFLATRSAVTMRAQKTTAVNSTQLSRINQPVAIPEVG